MLNPVLAEFVLSGDERSLLPAWARRPKSARARALRSRIILTAAEGLGNRQVAERLGIGPLTVGKWRPRLVAERLDGLLDEPRPGRPVHGRG